MTWFKMYGNKDYGKDNNEVACPNPQCEDGKLETDSDGYMRCRTCNTIWTPREKMRKENGNRMDKDQ